METREMLLEKMKDDDATVGVFQIKHELGLTNDEFCELLNS
ncbi:hypothetical protein [Macellibacteroides fermentans]